MPPVHTPLTQSPGPAQPWPVWQSGHDGPPQSTPVSVPFFTVSPQVGTWQTPPVQTAL